VIERLSPSHLIFFGKSIWESPELPDYEGPMRTLEADGVSIGFGSFRAGKALTLAIGVPHPSYACGYEPTHTQIRRFLAERAPTA